MMAEKQVKVKRVRVPLGMGRKARRKRYADYIHDRNKTRKRKNYERHMLLAKARRFRNHPEKATAEDAKAFHKLTA